MIKPFEKRVLLASPTMHGEELEYMREAYETNWMSTVGANINELERLIAEKLGCGHAVALSSGTSALHIAVRLAGEKLYGKPKAGHGSLEGRKVFATDMTFCATVNPIAYEGGEAVFIDSEYSTWNMDPDALEKAFELYPDVKLVVAAHLYGVPADIDRIVSVCRRHGALLVEDAAESFGAEYKGRQTGTFGDVGVISFNGNKIITGTSGGMLLSKDRDVAETARKWSTQSREKAAWYQHDELGYNYRMSNIVAGVARGQLIHLEEHISQKKAIYERYKKGFEGIPVKMDPFDPSICKPNYWLSCMIIDADAMCPQQRDDRNASYEHEKGRSCPTQILDKLDSINAEGRPIWKPMHMQPIYCSNGFVTCAGDKEASVDGDIFARGLCLPSDNKMEPWQQDAIIEAVRRCFDR